jgi:hypothetical protein
MPTITSLEELLASLSPYLKSAQPLEAMKKAGFTFTGEVGYRQAAELSRSFLRMRLRPRDAWVE